MLVTYGVLHSEKITTPGGNSAPIHKFTSQLLLVNIRKYWVSNLRKISPYNIHEEFDLLMGEVVEQGVTIYKFYFQILLCKHMKMFCFKFQQNCTIKEEFDFFLEGGGRDLLGLKGPRRVRGTLFINCNLDYY